MRPWNRVTSCLHKYEPLWGDIIALWVYVSFSLHSVLHFCWRNPIPFFEPSNRTLVRSLDFISSWISYSDISPRQWVHGSPRVYAVAQTQNRVMLLYGHIAGLQWVCMTGRGPSLFIDSVSGKVGVKSTRGETGGLQSFGVLQGHLWQTLPFITFMIAKAMRSYGTAEFRANTTIPHESEGIEWHFEFLSSKSACACFP